MESILRRLGNFHLGIQVRSTLYSIYSNISSISDRAIEILSGQAEVNIFRISGKDRRNSPNIGAMGPVLVCWILISGTVVFAYMLPTNLHPYSEAILPFLSIVSYGEYMMVILPQSPSTSTMYYDWIPFLVGSPPG